MYPAPCRALTAAAFLLASPVMAEDSLAPHQHGQAQLQLAISGDHIEAIFLSPAHNLLEFEHEPRTHEQHETLSQVTQWLQQTPLANTEDGSCTIHSASVHQGEPWEHDQETDHHDEHEHEHEGHDEADHHEEHSGHSDFEVTQVLECPELADAGTLATPLLEQFARLQQLDIAWVGPAGQGAVRLGQGDKSFILKP